MNVPFATLLIMLIIAFEVTRKDSFGSFLSAVAGIVLGVVVLVFLLR